MNSHSPSIQEPVLSPEPSSVHPVPGPSQQEPSHEATSAVRNALQLGGSLLVTYAIAMGVRFLLPPYLGPEKFGHFNWADGFTAVFFIATHFGLEMYIRKEVSLRPEHASDFFGTTMLLRLVLTGVLMAVLALVVTRSHAGEENFDEVRHLVLVFAAAQSLIIINASMAALLHAKGKVAGLSISNIVTKVVWGGGLLLVAVLKLPLPWLAVPLVASEAIKLVVGWRLAREHMGLIFKVDVPATLKVLKESLPFFLTGAALAANGRLDIMLLGFLAEPKEVGFYGAAWNIAGLTFFLNPVFGWVLMPLMSRAASRSHDELTELSRRALEGTLTVTVPMMMLIVLGAPLWVGLMGRDFAQAAMPLRLQSPLFVMAFVTMTASSWLTMTNRAWWVTITSIVGSLVLNPLFNLLLIPPMYAAMRDSGGGGGACATALAMLLMEVVVTISLLGRMGKAAFDRRLFLMMGKTAVVCLVVTALHLTVFASLNPWVRLGTEAVLYIAGVLGTGALRVADIQQVVVLVRRRRSEPVTTAAA